MRSRLMNAKLSSFLNAIIKLPDGKQRERQGSKAGADTDTDGGPLINHSGAFIRSRTDLVRYFVFGS